MQSTANIDVQQNLVPLPLYIFTDGGNVKTFPLHWPNWKLLAVVLERMSSHREAHYRFPLGYKVQFECRAAVSLLGRVTVFYYHTSRETGAESNTTKTILYFREMTRFEYNTHRAQHVWTLDSLGM